MKARIISKERFLNIPNIHTRKNRGDYYTCIRNYGYVDLSESNSNLVVFDSIVVLGNYRSTTYDFCIQTNGTGPEWNIYKELIEEYL